MRRKSHRAALVLVASLLAAPLFAQEPPKKTGPQKHASNRLAKETSPYLLLHAHNPVDWYPWGPEALAKAKAEKKLIFLSIGYSSCYWCHVMERESFMDEEIAAFLNKNFVCIKVDREERPDIDEIYMTALRVYYQVTGAGSGGGWPLSMFLTPEALPVAGGTYFPPRDKEGRTGFLTVLSRIDGFWQKDPDQVREVGKQLADFVRQTLRRRGPAEPLPGPSTLDEVQAALAGEYDARWGGFGYAEQQPHRPKFPEPANLFFLLDRARRGNTQARNMLVGTLERMSAGGIRDHLGGGFHRYSTDRYWRVPHFEKMLYDNGQLASVLVEAWQLTQRGDFKQIAEELLGYVQREMTSPEGAFYSALDAETNAEEGRYYVWTREEVHSALTNAEYDLFAPRYGLLGEPNFEIGGKEYYVLELSEAAREAEKQKPLDAQASQHLRAIRQKLLAVRDKRQRPLTDTKILTSWNGLMIRGFADCGRLFEKPQYTQAAAKAAEFVLKTLRTADGRLLRTYAGGQAKLNAYLDDYTYLAEGLIALHQATGDEAWLRAADELTQQQIRWFWDEEGGGFFYTSSDHEELLARSKIPADSATPAGSSIAASNLVYLAKALKKPEYFARAEATIRDSAGMLTRSPTAMPRMAVSLAALFDARKGQE
jgi:hypothetical protein